jgi:hypothetical protein
VESVEDAVGLIGEVGDVVEASPSAVEALVEATRRGVYEARKIAASHPALPAFCPLWRDPWITYAPATYTYDLLETCGARPVTLTLRATRERRHPIVDLGAVAAARPTLLLLPDRPFPFGPADVTELEQLLPAAHILRCDGRDLEWYGRRTAALPALARRIAEVARARQRP